MGSGRKSHALYRECKQLHIYVFVTVGNINKLLPQNSRHTRRVFNGSRGAIVSKDPALSCHPWRANIGKPSSGPHTLAMLKLMSY